MLAIAAVVDLNVADPLGSGFEVEGDCFLTNDRARIKSLVSRGLATAMGGNEFDFLINNGYAFYALSPKDFRNTNDPDTVLILWLQTRRLFLHCLWLIRDNSVNCEVGFLEHTVGHRARISSNHLLAAICMADGSRRTTTFSIDELREAQHFYNEHALPLVVNNASNMSANQPPRIVSAKGIPRLLRAQYFVQGARAADDLGIKTSLYMTSLEILFSNDAAELAHKLSERVACFLEQDANRRRDVFAAIKRAYAVRSKVVHGDVVTPKIQDDLHVVTQTIDDLVRRVMRRVYLETDTRNILEATVEEREQYFDELFFGSRPA